MATKRYARTSLTSLATIVVGAVLIVSAMSASADVHEGAGEHVATPMSYRFETIAEAQELVPFAIRLPAWQSPHEIAVVLVEIVPVYLYPDRPKMSVDILLHTPEGQLAWLHQTNYGTVPWGEEPQDRERLLEWSQTQINGSPAVVATSHAGTGYLYWIVGDVIFELQYPGRSGVELIPIASTIR